MTSRALLAILLIGFLAVPAEARRRSPPPCPGGQDDVWNFEDGTSGNLGDSDEGESMTEAASVTTTTTNPYEGTRSLSAPEDNGLSSTTYGPWQTAGVDFTVCGALRPNASTSPNYHAFIETDDWALGQVSPGSGFNDIRVSFFNQATEENYEYVTNWSTTTWYYVCTTRDGSPSPDDYEFYYNGSIAFTADMEPAAAASFRISNTGDYGAATDVDVVSVYPRILSLNDMVALEQNCRGNPNRGFPRTE